MCVCERDRAREIGSLLDRDISIRSNCNLLHHLSFDLRHMQQLHSRDDATIRVDLFYALYVYYYFTSFSAVFLVAFQFWIWLWFRFTNKQKQKRKIKSSKEQSSHQMKRNKSKNECHLQHTIMCNFSHFPIFWSLWYLQLIPFRTLFFSFATFISHHNICFVIKCKL